MAFDTFDCADCGWTVVCLDQPRVPRPQCMICRYLATFEKGDEREAVRRLLGYDNPVGDKNALTRVKPHKG